MISKTMRNSGGVERDGETFGISKRSPLPLLYYSSSPPPPPISIMKEINFFGKHASLDVSGDPPIRHLLYTFLLMINK